MDTPICDFVNKYIDSDFSRFHMPGHKGKEFIGCERQDITEIDGADVLSHADGIIFNGGFITVHKDNACGSFYGLQNKTGTKKF